MEKEEKSQKERDFLLQWGNRKRLRCVKLKKDSNFNNNNNNNLIKSSSSDCLDKRKISSSRFVSPVKDSSLLDQRLNNNNNNKNSSLAATNRKAVSPEKEDRYYTTRGSLGLDENGKMLGLDHHNGHLGENKGSFVWPKLLISLSSKEKEEDFMAMKGCKLPQRPKKRAKILQKSLLLVMPGSWLSDLCQERYEVREKKASKKRPRGLKAMGSMESDSE